MSEPSTGRSRVLGLRHGDPYGLGTARPPNPPHRDPFPSSQLPPQPPTPPPVPEVIPDGDDSTPVVTNALPEITNERDLLDAVASELRLNDTQKDILNNFRRKNGTHKAGTEWLDDFRQSDSGESGSEPSNTSDKEHSFQAKLLGQKQSLRKEREYDVFRRINPDLRRSYDSDREPDLGHSGRTPLFREIPRDANFNSVSATSSSEGSDVEAHLRRKIQTLKREKKSLKDKKYKQPGANNVPVAPMPEDPLPPLPSYTCITFYIIRGVRNTYLGEPHWELGDSEIVLRADRPLRNADHYLDQHPEIAYIFYKEYNRDPPHDRSKVESKDGVFRKPKPFSEYLRLVSEHLIDAVSYVADHLPGFDDLFENFEPTADISAPYLEMYYAIPLLEDVVSGLSPIQAQLLDHLSNSILMSYGEEYRNAKRLFKKGLVTSQLLKYLVKPGDVLVLGSSNQGYIASSWAIPTSARSEYGDTVNPGRSNYGSIQRQHSSNEDSTERLSYHWRIDAWSWAFDGVFQAKPTKLSLKLSVTFEGDEVEIDQLKVFPLAYSHGSTLRNKLETRGTMFWKCRQKHIVSYLTSTEADLSHTGERYIVDTETYKLLHPGEQYSIQDLKPDITHERMMDEEPLTGDELLVFPSTIPGYNLQTKKWAILNMDYVTDVVWNKQAFGSLEIDREAKELVQALVENKLAAEKSTDLISGKGSGLIILLHGGPGTGKTFTAEGVAEIAEKPLYRITCGDVGTKPEKVEKYLKAVLHLGKIWDCVVLLDEADVFLEERDRNDLKRNALVSVFLHVLEYYSGILILTSNRVGTFDEAFKSRIQLVLHYENLIEPQRRKIWRNFFSRLKELDEANIDYEDLIDHIDELGKEDMNGRHIRNAITTARQLAKHKKSKFGHAHLKHVIRVSGRFETYLKTLKGQPDDEIKKQDLIR